MTTLLIDNYDSFTWNVYQILSNLGASVAVHRNDELTLDAAIQLKPRNIVISPGPGHPSSAGISNDLITYFAGKIPILGVCLGQQCIYEIYGGRVVGCGELVHGKTTPILHDGKGLFEGVGMRIECTRYHSLAGDPNTLPDSLEINAWTESGIVMGVRHKSFVLEGVQFHPESIASEQGAKIFSNFLSWTGGYWSELEIHPEFITRLETVSVEKSQIGKGIPLSKVSKLNSTAVHNTKMSIESDSILKKIVGQRKIDIDAEKVSLGNSMEYLERCYALGLAPLVLSFPDRLKYGFQQDGIAILAEVKRASPSKGTIDANAHAPQQALLYAEGGASAISVLTEPNWFHGSLDDLKMVRMALENVPNRPAVLRKEFIFDKYQILQARLAGADSVLLIVSILDDQTLDSLINYSRMLAMEPLVEVVSIQEVHRAIKVGAKVIGVNNRDLNTFNVDMNRTFDLSALVPKDVILLALSGITGRADVDRFMTVGVSGVLVGESLMKSQDRSEAVRVLRGKASLTNQPVLEISEPLVKICGLTNKSDALCALNSGSDYLGFIFAPESPRYISPEAVKHIINELNPTKSLPTTRKDPYKAALIPPHAWFTRNCARQPIPLMVGVFTNESPAEINRITDMCKLDMIQLHLPKSSSFRRLLNRPVIQVISISTETGLEGIKQEIKECVGSAYCILLDTSTKELVGGTGVTFNWDLVLAVGIPVWMAGGLTPDNVSEARRVKPMVIDVSSGVESEKGMKDHKKVKLFIQRAKQPVA